MVKYFISFSIVFALSCFTNSSTFPVHSDTCIGCTNHRTKNMASFENTLRKIKDTTHDIKKNIYEHFNTGFKSLTNRNFTNEDDIRQYEQLVIMKKYPYLDTRELDMKYFPAFFKHTRYKDGVYFDRKMQHETSLNEPGEDLLNVEISNRGLTGFAIPPHMSKQGIIESKSNIKPVESPENSILTKNVLQSLRQDINTYIDKKNVPIF